MSCMIYDIQSSFGQTQLSVPKNVLPKDCDRKNVQFPPGTFVGCWAPTEVLLSTLSWWVMWLSLDLRGPSGFSQSLGMLVKEGEVQPGFLALQTLGHFGRNGVAPEAVGKDTDLSSSSCLYF